MMLPRLAAGQGEAVAAAQRHLADMARNGFRTLVIAQRDVSAQEYQVITREILVSFDPQPAPGCTHPRAAACI